LLFLQSPPINCPDPSFAVAVDIEKKTAPSHDRKLLGGNQGKSSLGENKRKTERSRVAPQPVTL
jgi:hypothetical protein